MDRLVLIVDDSRTSRMVIRQYIEARRPHWTVLEASTGDEAMAMAQHCPVDLVTMDINMPGISGLTAGTFIQSRKAGSVVVFLSANIQHAVRQKIEDAGMHLLAKPVTETLIDTLLQLTKFND